MYEQSEAKVEIIKVLTEWDYAATRASYYNIAKKINRSPATIVPILRYLREVGLVTKSHGSWRLV